jgi:hypothetical protein
MDPKTKGEQSSDRQSLDTETIKILKNYDFKNNSILTFCKEYNSNPSTIRRYIKLLEIQYKSKIKYNIPRDEKGKFCFKGIKTTKSIHSTLIKKERETKSNEDKSRSSYKENRKKDDTFGNLEKCLNLWKNKLQS